ncbi:hypothetical protein PFISCL1PPCAC_27137, partial [Pristionchus fissidentatus]
FVPLRVRLRVSFSTMLPVSTIVAGVKHLFSVVTILFWVIYVIVRFCRQGWALVKKKEHTMPERLEKEFNHKFVQLTDVRLHYVEEGDKSKPLLLFVHGFPEFWYSWRYQIKHFAKTHHVVAIDQRGYGESDKPRGVDNYSTKKLAQDIKEVIERLGHEKAILIGHDFGGAASWVTALTYPDVVEKLIVLNCPHPGAFARTMWKVKKQILKSWHFLFFQVPWIPEITLGFDDHESLDYAYRSKFAGLKNQVNFTDEDMEAWKATYSKRSVMNAPVNYYRALAKNTADIKEMSKKIVKPPVLIIWGEEDPFLVVECASLSQERCKDGQVEYIAGSSHWVQQDQPEKVNEAIEKFIS